MDPASPSSVPYKRRRYPGKLPDSRSLAGVEQAAEPRRIPAVPSGAGTAYVPRYVPPVVYAAGPVITTQHRPFQRADYNDSASPATYIPFTSSPVTYSSAALPSLVTPSYARAPATSIPITRVRTGYQESASGYQSNHSRSSSDRYDAEPRANQTIYQEHNATTSRQTLIRTVLPDDEVKRPTTSTRKTVPNATILPSERPWSSVWTSRDEALETRTPRSQDTTKVSTPSKRISNHADKSLADMISTSKQGLSRNIPHPPKLVTSDEQEAQLKEDSQWDVLPSYLHDFARIPVGEFETLATYILKNRVVLNADTQLLFKEAKRAYLTGETSYAEGCVQQGVLIRRLHAKRKQEKERKLEGLLATLIDDEAERASFHREFADTREKVRVPQPTLSDAAELEELRVHFPGITERIRKAVSYNKTLSYDKVDRMYSARIVVRWKVFEFLERQFGATELEIDSVLTLTGSVPDAQAATCGDYIRSTWRDTGAFLLSFFQQLWESRNTPISAPEQENSTFRMPGLRLELFRDASFGSADAFKVEAVGYLHLVYDLIDGLAWTGAALHPSPYDDELAYCKCLHYCRPDARSMGLRFETAPIETDNNACWVPLFCGASIAHGFEIASRHGEKGLEIPLQILAALVGAFHAVEYGDAVVIKGYSRMIIPTQRQGNVVQWHLVSNADCDRRLSYQEGFARCPRYANREMVNLECLWGTRAILGWCTSAESTLGSAEANYDNIDYSGAEDNGRPLSFTGGTLGIQQIGLAQINFRLGPKDGKCHFQRTGTYEIVVDAAKKTPIVLYDTLDRRAWLVPACDVILHICRHRQHSDPITSYGEPDEFSIMHRPRRAAADILLESGRLGIADSTYAESNYSFKDQVLAIWSLLEFLIDHNVRIEQTSSPAMRGTLRENLHGYEYKAIVENRSPLRKKQTMLAKTCGGWPALARDIDALVLFGSGFGDVIRPVKNHDYQNLCTQWRGMPIGKDYLGASVETMKDLYNVAGSRLNRKYLSSSRLMWHRGSTLFEACTDPGNYRCSCSRVQQIMPASTLQQKRPTGALIDGGAVILGEDQSPLSRLLTSKPVSDMPKMKGLYSLPNSTIGAPSLNIGFENGLRSMALLETRTPSTDKVGVASVDASSSMNHQPGAVGPYVTSIPVRSLRTRIAPQQPSTTKSVANTPATVSFTGISEPGSANHVVHQRWPGNSRDVLLQEPASLNAEQNIQQARKPAPPLVGRRGGGQIRRQHDREIRTSNYSVEPAEKYRRRRRVEPYLPDPDSHDPGNRPEAGVPEDGRYTVS